MSQRNELELKTSVAILAVLIMLGTLVYSLYSSWQTSKRVAKLESVLAIKDSMQQAGLKRMDSAKVAKVYMATVQAYENAADSLFTQNQNLKNSGDQYLTLVNQRSEPIRIAVAFRGINRTWFTEGLLTLKAKEKMRIWGVDSTSSVYIHLTPSSINPSVLINGDNLKDLNKVNLSVDTTSSFIFTGNTPPPHKTAHLAIFHEVIPTVKDQIIFTDK
jgi:type II secretory pathway pseudopilin PulG